MAWLDALEAASLVEVPGVVAQGQETKARSSCASLLPRAATQWSTCSVSLLLLAGSDVWNENGERHDRKHGTCARSPPTWTSTSPSPDRDLSLSLVKWTRSRIRREPWGQSPSCPASRPWGRWRPRPGRSKASVSRRPGPKGGVNHGKRETDLGLGGLLLLSVLGLGDGGLASGVSDLGLLVLLGEDGGKVGTDDSTLRTRTSERSGRLMTSKEGRKGRATDLVLDGLPRALLGDLLSNTLLVHASVDLGG